MVEHPKITAWSCTSFLVRQQLALLPNANNPWPQRPALLFAREHPLQYTEWITSRRKMLEHFTEAQLERYEAFRRSKFDRKTMKRVRCATCRTSVPRIPFPDASRSRG